MLLMFYVGLMCLLDVIFVIAKCIDKCREDSFFEGAAYLFIRLIVTAPVYSAAVYGSLFLGVGML